MAKPVDLNIGDFRDEVAMLYMECRARARREDELVADIALRDRRIAELEQPTPAEPEPAPEPEPESEMKQLGRNRQ